MSKSSFDQIASGMRDAIAISGGDSAKYYGPAPVAVAVASELLGLQTTGHEQDWEFEYATPDRAPQILRVYHRDLPLEVRQALALLLIASAEEQRAAADPTDDAEAIKALLASDPEVLQSMRFYWLEQARATDMPFVRLLLSA
jgi:hypothetical protein